MDGQAVYDQEDRVIGAFEGCKQVLAAFAQCENEHDLAAVRDGFRLCMASQLCPKEIESVTKVVKAVGAQDTLLSTTNAARKCNEWPKLCDCVGSAFSSVGSSFDDIWGKLEVGRGQWLNARYATQALKANLQAAYKSAGSVGDGAGAAEDDQLDAKMVWIYAVGTVLPPCAGQAAAWAGAARIQVREQPLVGYDPALWDPRRLEFQELDVCVGQAAEAGGTDLADEWHRPQRQHPQ